MNKLITSLACGTVLSISLLGSGYAANAAGTGGGMSTTIPDTGATGTRTEGIREMNGAGTRLMNQQGNTMMNQTTGTMRNGDNMVRDAGRTGNNSTVSPLNNTTQTGRYRATATTNATDNDNDTNWGWGWLGLIGLLGLAGMRSRSGERDRR